ncbi:MAG: hypothetical protein ACT4QA_04305 [Panacagrimonas sp.]
MPASAIKADHHYTYADYLKFPPDERWEIIVGEFWLLHPVDRILIIFRLGADGKFGASEVQELKGRTAVTAVHGLEIDWDLWEPLADE